MELIPFSKEKALAEHERLHRLFKENRFAFELERKQAIETAIERARTLRFKKELQKIQDRVDHILNHSGSSHNRLVLMQMMFWRQVTEKFIPAVASGSKKKNG